MKRFHLFLSLALGLLCTQTILAQAVDTDTPVDWSFTLGQDGDMYAVLAKAEIAEGWYVYSQFMEAGGPVPTAIDLTDTEGIMLVGDATEAGEAISGYDELFAMEVAKYAHAANFSQGFTLPEGATEVSGLLEFMACTSKKCLPPSTVEISLATDGLAN